jgi:hypothetical protein
MIRQTFRQTMQASQNQRLSGINDDTDAKTQNQRNPKSIKSAI